MPRFGSTPFAFPEFRGATRRLVLWNLAAYFALALALGAALIAITGVISALLLQLQGRPR